MYIDLKCNPAKYVESTFKIAMLMEEKESSVCFAPLRTSCVPCHIKIDTDTLSSIILDSVDCKKRKEDIGKENRELGLGTFFQHEEGQENEKEL